MVAKNVAHIREDMASPLLSTDSTDMLILAESESRALYLLRNTSGLRNDPGSST